MENLPISADDITDVVEMVDKIEDLLCDLLEDNASELVISALLNVTINATIFGCNSVNEAKQYRAAIIHGLDRSLEALKRKLNQDTREGDP